MGVAEVVQIVFPDRETFDLARFGLSGAGQLVQMLPNARGRAVRMEMSETAGDHHAVDVATKGRCRAVGH